LEGKYNVMMMMTMLMPMLISNMTTKIAIMKRVQGTGHKLQQGEP
jgi:ribosomal protein S9